MNQYLIYYILENGKTNYKWLRANNKREALISFINSNRESIKEIKIQKDIYNGTED